MSPVQKSLKIQRQAPSRRPYCNLETRALVYTSSGIILWLKESRVICRAPGAPQTPAPFKPDRNTAGDITRPNPQQRPGGSVQSGSANEALHPTTLGSGFDRDKEQNQILNVKQGSLTFTFYGVHVLQQNLQNDADAAISRREKLLVMTSAVRAKLPRLNLRLALAPTEIRSLRREISEYLAREEDDQLTKLLSFVSAEHSSSRAIHLNDERHRDIYREYHRKETEIRCCESEMLLAIASQEPHDCEARLVALANEQAAFEKEYDAITLRVLDLEAENAASRRKAQQARVAADGLRRAAKQMAEHNRL
ncbi:hypothetical protein FB451DRAFT_1180790 [Mycena latifolia]|nr:hypothetical protein FB451DRAFT_1180790 [Mycena latifolia]